MPLDIRKITRKGLLVPGNGFSWQWLVNDRQVAGISIRVNFDHGMLLSYRMKSTGEVVEQRVQTQTSLCHLGGQRHWFICPRCSKRVAVLYAPGRYFACRQCGGLGYTTQKEGIGDRASTKADKLRKRMGWEAGILNGNPASPKVCIGRPTSNSKAATMRWYKSACMKLAASWVFCTNCLRRKSVSQNRLPVADHPICAPLTL